MNLFFKINKIIFLIIYKQFFNIKKMNFLCHLFGVDLWKAVIRPSRDKYEIKDLGPFKFEVNGKNFKRTDLELPNKRNLKIMCSFWEPFDEERTDEKLPCVIYLHGNSSSRCEAVSQLKYLLSLNITVFALDFCGCGKSNGKYISLGWYEKDDVECVVNFLRRTNKVSKIGLWGRSMGAVTAIMYGASDPTISALVLDSPFYSLNLLINEIVDQKVSVPKFILDRVLKSVKATIKEKAGFNIDDLETYKFAEKCKIPACFCHGNNDTFVNCHHSMDLYKKYNFKEKKKFLVKGNHNTARPKDIKNFLALFFHDKLFTPKAEVKRANSLVINRIKNSNFQTNNIMKLKVSICPKSFFNSKTHQRKYPSVEKNNKKEDLNELFFEKRYNTKSIRVNSNKNTIENIIKNNFANLRNDSENTLNNSKIFPENEFETLNKIRSSSSYHNNNIRGLKYNAKTFSTPKNMNNTCKLMYTNSENVSEMTEKEVKDFNKSNVLMTKISNFINCNNEKLINQKFLGISFRGEKYEDKKNDNRITNIINKQSNNKSNNLFWTFSKKNNENKEENLFGTIRNKNLKNNNDQKMMTFSGSIQNRNMRDLQLLSGDDKEDSKINDEDNTTIHQESTVLDENEEIVGKNIPKK